MEQPQTSNIPNTRVPYFMQGGGEMGELVRDFDWRQTPLGDPDTWPQTLRTTLGIVLHGSFPMFLFWGPEALCFYNDAYRPSLGNNGKHPDALGKPAREVWPEIWHIMGPQLRLVMSEGANTWHEDQPVTIFRNGQLEEGCWTFSYSPVFEEDGSVAGVMVTCTETTEKVKLLRHMELEGRHFRSLAENLPDAIARHTPGGQFLYVNPEFEKLYGRAAREVIGKNCTDLGFPEEEVRRWQRIISEVVQTGASRQLTYEQETPAGQRILQTRLVPEKHPSGAVETVLSIISDITQEALKTRELAKLQQELQLVFNHIPSALFLFDATGRLVYLNDRAARLFGDETADEILKNNDLDSLQRRSLQLYDRYDATGRLLHLSETPAARAFSTGKPTYDFVRLAPKDGGPEQWQLLQAAPVLNETGAMTSLLLTVTDITEQRQAQAHSDMLRRQLEAITDSTPDLIYTIGLDYRFTYANNALLAMWGKTWEESKGRGLRELGYEEWHADMHEREIDEVVATQKAIRGTVTFPHAQFGTRFYDYIFTPVLNAANEVVAVAGTTRDVTDFKQAEERLLEQKQQLDDSLERFNLINRATQDAIWDWNLLTNEVQWNEATQSMFGYNPEGIGPDAAWWYGTIHPEDMDRVVGHIHEAIDGGNKHWATEYRFRCADGTYKMVYDRGFVLHDKQGQPIRMLGSMQDNTERKRTERILAGQKEAFEQTVRHEPLERVLTTLARTAENASRNGLLCVIRLLDATGTRLGHGAAPSLPEAFNEFMDGTLIGPNSGSCGTALFRGETLVVTDIETDPVWDNHREQALVHGLRSSWSAPILTSGGEFLGALAIYYKYPGIPPEEDCGISELLSQAAGVVIEWSRQVAQRAEAEAALRESEERFRVLAETLPQMIWMNDADGNPLYRSRHWNDYFEGDTEAAWQEHCEPGDRAAADKTFRLARERKCSFRSEVRLRNRDGEYRWHTSIAEPILDAAGEVVQWIGALIDIHDQKTISARLERLVQERTAELSRSNEDLQQFAHVASHDLKEPVRKIATFAKMLEDADGDALSERGRTCLSKVQHAADRMMHMVNGVLAYSQLAAAEQTYEVIDLTAIISSAEADLEVVMQQKEARITVGKLPHIAGAPVLIHQLFYNLINNALKFSRPDVPTVITVTGSLQEDGMAEIIVADNGIGFEQEYAERIFKSFSRLNSKDKYEGTGLGLALCRKIVTRHGGGITAQGTPGEGARFLITLPALPETA